MGLFDKVFKKKEIDIHLPDIADDAIVSVGAGEIVDIKTVSDAMFAEQMMGKSCAFRLTGENVVAPVNGTIEVAFPTGHAFAIRAKDGTGILVHIGVDTVSLNGKGFKTLVKVGQTVKAGQPCVRVNWPFVKSAGFDCSVILIVTEPMEGRTYDFIPPQKVDNYQKITK